MTIWQILRNKNILKIIAPLDRELLLSSVINKPREYLLAHPKHKISKPQAARYKSYVRRRLRGEPIAYLTGRKEFFGLEFQVDKNVLIPRPETELLVEIVLENILKSQISNLKSSLIDVGTGSGNIIVSVIKNLPANFRRKIDFYATDISKKALLTAENNAKKHNLAKYINFIESDLLGFIPRKKIKGNIVIVANLPYVSGSLYGKNKNNLKYEPKKALLSGKNGLKHYERLIKQAKKMLPLVPCSLIIEISPEQKNGLAKIVKKELPSVEIDFLKDLSGRTRAAEIELKNLH